MDAKGQKKKQMCKKKKQ